LIWSRPMICSLLLCVTVIRLSV